MYNMIERKDLQLFQSTGGTTGISENLSIDLTHGLTSARVLEMREKYGANELPQAESVTYLGLVKEALQDLMMRMLIVAAVVSIVFGMTLKDPHTDEVDRSTGWIEGTAILISVSLVVNVTAINDYKKAKKFEAMSAEQSKKDIEVMRNGEKMSIDLSELVVGDLMFVAAGQALPADAVLVKGQDLKVDESAVTGETDVMKKRMDTDPFFISGTNILEGDGVVMVINVGVNSFAGKLAMSSRGAPSDTPLQVKLGWLAEMIGKLGLAAAVLTFTVLCIKEIVKICTGDHSFNISTFLDFLMVSITLVVVAIPEGLPLAVTISLAYSMKEMMKDNCLVRVLAACETMGGTNAICSDKTGTLTMNAMTVVQGWVAEDNFVINGYGVTGGANPAVTEAGATDLNFRSSPETIDLLCDAIAYNSACEELLVDGKLVWVGGNKTEHGLVGFVTRCKRDYRAIRNQVPGEDRRSYPFSSARKRMTTLIRLGGKCRTFIKGASEMVVEDCSHALTPSGVVVLDEHYRAGLLQTIEQMADQGNRTIAIAYFDPEDKPFPEEEPIFQYVLIAIVGIQDPIRQEVPDAIRACNQAGINVRMVTGDNKNTAIAIAKKCGLLGAGAVEEGQVMEGREFRQLAAQKPELLRTLIPKLKVLARSSPTDKLVLVAYLMDEGDIVAVTGDGTNDAPALKLADVGFAMHSGTDVATGAAEMVLMDDNFATVVRAAVWGRTVNENVRKFLQFQLTVNVSGVLMTLIGSAISETNTEPLRPVQLLWLNLIMDTLAALALATETPAPNTLTKPGSGPISRAAPLISNRMWVFIIIHAMWQLGMVIFLLYIGVYIFDIGPCDPDDYYGKDHNGRCQGGKVNLTIVFNVYIWMQLFNEFNARKLYGEKNCLEGMQRSKLFFVIFCLCVVFQFCAVQYFQDFMSTTPLNVSQWFICIGLASSELFVGLLVTAIPVPTWKPKSTEENKNGLDAVKKTIIKEAIANAGMIAMVGAEREGPPLRGPRERWAFAIAGVMSNQRVVKAIVESADNQISNTVIRRRRDSSLLAFRNHHPAARGTGIRIV
eukprot:GGOE01008108.1.p1 GENE.GGOE01008108.1~~GGOE01008108.1.p1  ORF type:complete len:1105 (-),score=368.79 GGOE01008108.1:645-3824(-)